MWVILAKTKLPQFGKFFPVFCLICQIVWRRVKNDVKIFCWNKRRFRRFFFMFTFHVSSNSGISVPYFSKDFDQTKGFRFSSKKVLILATKLLWTISGFDEFGLLKGYWNIFKIPFVAWPTFQFFPKWSKKVQKTM